MDEAPQFQFFVFELVFDARHAFRRRAVVRQLEDAAQQYRDVFEFSAGPLLDFRNHQMRQIGIWAAEIKKKSYLGHLTRPPGKDACRARRSRRRAAAGRAASTPRQSTRDSSADPA